MASVIRRQTPIQVLAGSNPGPPVHSGQRRLSRVVKCKTLDFTEFPEGMREYSRLSMEQKSPGFYMMEARRVGYGNKIALRESQSQPGSPMSIPRIQIQDFGSRFNVHFEVNLTKFKLKILKYSSHEVYALEHFFLDYFDRQRYAISINESSKYDVEKQIISLDIKDLCNQENIKLC